MTIEELADEIEQQASKFTATSSESWIAGRAHGLRIAASMVRMYAMKGSEWPAYDPNTETDRVVTVHRDWAGTTLHSTEERR